MKYKRKIKFTTIGHKSRLSFGWFGVGLRLGEQLHAVERNGLFREIVRIEIEDDRASRRHGRKRDRITRSGVFLALPLGTSG